MIEEELAAKYSKELMYSIQKHVLLHNVFSLDEAHNLALEAEEMMIQPLPFMRFYRSNETTEQYQ